MSAPLTVGDVGAVMSAPLTVGDVGAVMSAPLAVRDVGAVMSAPLTVRDVMDVIGAADLDELRRHHVDLVSVTAELARAADMDWPWCHDDPTVAVLRALAIVAPEAESHRAVELCDEFRPDPHRFGRAVERLFDLSVS